MRWPTVTPCKDHDSLPRAGITGEICFSCEAWGEQVFATVYGEVYTHAITPMGLGDARMLHTGHSAREGVLWAIAYQDAMGVYYDCQEGWDGLMLEPDYVGVYDDDEGELATLGHYVVKYSNEDYPVLHPTQDHSYYVQDEHDTRMWFPTCTCALLWAYMRTYNETVTVGGAE